ncbi:MAG: six-cysteine ranthipeptide SCIFF [Anaerovoracaceae bacterium]
MKRIRTLETRDLRATAAQCGCGECQTSCQSASKTSCSVANQQCEQQRQHQ